MQWVRNLPFVTLTALVLAAGSCGLMGSRAAAGEAAKVYPLAVFPFQERGTGVKGYGQKVSDILFASLVTDPALYLVEREEIKKLLDEHELNLSGMVTPGQAVQVGQLTGARILVTGSVIEVGKSNYIVAKIIGTETSRVLGASVKGGAKNDLDGLVGDLAKKVASTVKERADQLVAKETRKEDRIAALKEKLGQARRPVVFVRITERHVGQATIDPAAQTEMILVCKETGFEVLDPDKGTPAKADVTLTGEGFSEFALRRGNLVSVKARLEVKATDRETDKLLATDRQVAVTLDLTEQIAGKSALQRAAFDIALRMLPKVVEAWNKRPAAEK